MDGFKSSDRVVVLGATNRINDLDSALLRPGRFDVHVHVPVPDLETRKDLIRLALCFEFVSSNKSRFFFCLLLLTFLCCFSIEPVKL